MFSDRTDAGQQLARGLESYRRSNPLVLGLPRGGVVVAAAIARALQCDLDVLLVKKLRAPDNPELALGAVCEEGRVFINEEVLRLTGADDFYLEAERRERLAEIADQRRRYRAVKPRQPLTGRTILLVDDGLATGATMIAAAGASALSRPQELVVAVPVSHPETIDTLEAMPMVDRVVCLEAPVGFIGVGQFYQDFTQVSDEEVVAILKQFA